MPFFRQQIMMLLPVSALVWIPGLAFSFQQQSQNLSLPGHYLSCFSRCDDDSSKARTTISLPSIPCSSRLAASSGKSQSHRHTKFRRLKVALPAAVFALGVIAIPLNIPILPVDEIVPYMNALGIKMSRTEVQDNGPLPQHFGDEFGWEEMVAATARFTSPCRLKSAPRPASSPGTYGDAGAIDFFGAATACPNPSVPTKIITTGVRANTLAKSSSSFTTI